jgi:hypothetical protein
MEPFSTLSQELDNGYISYFGDSEVMLASILIFLLYCLIGAFIIDITIVGYLAMKLGRFEPISNLLEEVIFTDCISSTLTTDVKSKHSDLLNYSGYANKKIVITKKDIIIRNTVFTYLLQIPIQSVYGYKLRMKFIDDEITVFFNHNNEFNYITFRTENRIEWLNVFKQNNINETR